MQHKDSISRFSEAVERFRDKMKNENTITIIPFMKKND